MNGHLIRVADINRGCRVNRVMCFQQRHLSAGCSVDWSLEKFQAKPRNHKQDVVLKPKVVWVETLRRVGARSSYSRQVGTRRVVVWEYVLNIHCQSSIERR